MSNLPNPDSFAVPDGSAPLPAHDPALADIPAALSEVAEPQEQAAPVADAPAAAPLSALDHVPVRVEAVLGRTRIAVTDLLALSPGAVIELDRKVGEPVDILVSDRLIARGEVVLIDGLLGVTITQIVRADEA